MLKKLLQVTLENNKILKDIQENGISISLPDFGAKDSVEEPAKTQITKVAKTKISKTIKDVIPNNSGITAWIDVETKLTWEFKSDDRRNLIMSQKECDDYIDNLNILEYSGFDDWRLPTLKELKSLLASEKTNFSYIKKPLSKNTNYNYWTSTKYDENFHMTVNFNNKKDLKNSKTNLEYIRCVRS